jgi:hypothetical protein
MKKSIRRLSSAAQATESHWTLWGMLSEHWGNLLVAASAGGGGWLGWVIKTAQQATGYEIALWVSGIGLFFGACVAALLSHLEGRKLKMLQGEAVASGLSWSGYSYGKGAVVDGGTHSLADIFGADRLRVNLIFRNCQIVGPGIIALIKCNVEKTEFFALPDPIFIEPSSDLAPFAPQFLSCRFENCTFSDIAIISNPLAPEMVVFKLAK